VTRIVLVNNLSAEPFRLIKPAFATALSELPPSQTWQAARSGQVDVALVSLARTPDVASVMEPAGNFGVACRGAVGSVLLLSRIAPPEVARRGLAIHLTAQSETSVMLLRRLWHTEFGVPLMTTARPSEAVGRLCIGNEARKQQMSGQWSSTVDLGQWWHARTGLPFVFARWMIDASLPQGQKEAVRAWLSESASLARSRQGKDRMIERAMQQMLFGERAAADLYFSSLISRFSQAEVQAEARFLDSIVDAK
jgi:chorismate dehydratase